jgi:predicted acyl esterase
MAVARREALAAGPALTAPMRSTASAAPTWRMPEAGAVAYRALVEMPMPDRVVVGAKWEPTWREWLYASPAIIARWMAHDREDTYWRHGLPRFDYAAIRCPTYVVGGWADAKVNLVPRLIEGLTCPHKAPVGPWGHLSLDRRSGAGARPGE